MAPFPSDLEATPHLEQTVLFLPSLSDSQNIFQCSNVFSPSIFPSISSLVKKSFFLTALTFIEMLIYLYFVEC